MIIWHALGSHWKPLDLLKFIQVLMLTLAVTQFTTEETNSFFLFPQIAATSHPWVNEVRIQGM
jgi:hypothetical protein